MRSSIDLALVVVGRHFERAEQEIEIVGAVPALHARQLLRRLDPAAGFGHSRSGRHEQRAAESDHCKQEGIAGSCA